jgi:4-carboxymuconolactone decarboxylase
MHSILSKGSPAPANYFTGTVWVNIAVQPEDALNCTVGKVTFAPTARTNWHTHRKGQTLIVTDGTGYYQEKGKPIQIIQQGDVVKILPGVEHWHGASHDSEMTHIAIVADAEKDSTIWLQPVTTEEYNS